MKSNGIFDTRIMSLGIIDHDKGDHVYCGVPGKVYETTDGAETWKISPGSEKLGSCYSFKNGTINGEPHILASCDAGIGNIPTKLATKGGEWNVIPPGGWGRGGYLTVADAGNGKLLPNSVLGGCLGGHVFVGTIVNKTAADWSTVNGTGRPCVMLAMNPNDQSMDGGLTYENLNHSNIFHCGIDRKGALYTGAMGGAFVSHDCGPGPNMKRPCSWHGYYDNRTARRTGHSTIRGAHDYQRINLDFGGSVGFVSDQGLFIVNYTNSSELELIKANGNLSNNIALKAAISKGGGTKETRSIVTAIWDWAPVASWDNGAHWPSWQTPQDGPGASCIGEGGGSYAQGASNHMHVMHHHNIMYSACGGQNMTRMITPHAGTVFGPTYQIKPGSQTAEPNGFFMAPLFITVPWDVHFETILDPSTCQNKTDITANLTQHTNYSCLSAVDFGYVYGTHSADYATWDGSSCITCQVAGNQSDWKWGPKTGSVSYSRKVKESERSYRKMMKFDMNGDGVLDESDMAASIVNKETNDDDDPSDDHSDNEFSLEAVDTRTAFEQTKKVGSGGGPVYILKSFNFGAGLSNWTYTLLPAHVGVPNFVTDPSNQSVIYTVNAGCIAASYDTGDTWTPCWNETGHAGLTGSFGGMAIKNSTHMIISRNNDVPLRTKDGGATWTKMESCRLVANFHHGISYSWTGKTLIMMGSGGTPTTDHPHAPFVWVSKDDGESWSDETGGLVTMGPGEANWYEGDFYINSMGEGIMYKTLE